MIKINLLAEAKRPAAVRRTRTASRLEGEQLSQYLLLGGLVLCLAICAIWWFMLQSQTRNKQREVAEARREEQELAPIIKEVEDYKAKQSELERKIEVISELKANQRGPVRVMDEVSRAMPELLWLTRMDVTSGTVAIEGLAFNTNAVATFTENLDRVPEFQEPDFQETKRSGEIYSFTLRLGYSLTPPEQELEDDAEGLDPALNAAGGA